MRDFFIGFGVGIILELFALSEVYKAVIPQAYINANATLFLLVLPLLIVVVGGSWLWFGKKRVLAAAGVVSGFVLCLAAFFTLISLGGGM
jgi:hypothetical protein